MRVTIPPSGDLDAYNPRSLLKFFLVAGEWTTYAEFADNLNQFIKDADNIATEGLINDWANKNRRPTGIYRLAFFKLIQDHVDPRYSDQWRIIFIRCWSKFRAETDEQKHQIKEQARSKNKLSHQILIRHRCWIEDLYFRFLRDEQFAISDIYVPIRVLIEQSQKGSDQSIGSLEQSDLIEAFISKFELHQESVWFFIKGGPGSGKSIQALSIAYEICKKQTCEILFCRLNRTIENRELNTLKLPELVSDVCGIKYLLEQLKFSKLKHAVLIIDGLDEIGARGGKQTQKIINETLDAIRTQTNALLQFGVSVTVVAYGRETITAVAAKDFLGENQLLTMGNLSGKFSRRNRDDIIYDDDLRPLWWQKFVVARKLQPTQIIPEFFSDTSHPLFELGKEPLLAYLICRMALKLASDATTTEQAVELVDKRTRNENRNGVYAQIIDDIRDPSGWKLSGRELPIPPEVFQELLSNIALATWQHGSNRTATIPAIRSTLKSERLQNAFERLMAGYDHSGSANLITAFYYRIGEPNSSSLEYEFEFTHKTFSEYLLATYIFDAFELLLDSEITGTEKEQMQCQHDWLELVHAGSETPEIAQFLIDEASLRLRSRKIKDWNKSLKLVRRLSHLAKLSNDTNEVWMHDSSIAKLKRGALLVWLCWNTIWRAQYLQTNETNDLGKGEMPDSYDLRLLQSPYDISGSAFLGEESSISPPTFLSSALSGLNIYGDSLPGLYLSEGQIVGLSIESTTLMQIVLHNLEMTNIKLLKSDLSQSSIVGGIISGSHIDECALRRITIGDSTGDTQFEDLNIQRCDFGQSEFLNTTFYDCTFHSVQFTRSGILNSMFEGCTFEDIEFDICQFEAVTFENCKFINVNFDDTDTTNSTFISCEGVDF